MKKKLISTVLICALLTGCGSSNNLLLPYETNSDVAQSNDYKYMSADVSDFFASDRTIITDEYNHMSDNAINATAALLVNSTKDEVIFANNVYEKLYPASITKIMTALVVLKNADLADIVTISYNASHITESGAKLVGFKEGDQVELGTLLELLLLYSGNDAGIAIAEYVGGSEEGFAKMMNDTAKSLGAVHTNFVNAHGLHDDNHYTTAYDLYLIFEELIEYDKFLSIINLTKVTATYLDASNRYIEKEFTTTNRYLKGTEDVPDGVVVVGGKTGTTYKAGNCLILYSKDDNNNSYISIILQADSGNSLFSQMTRLLEMIP